MLGFNSKKKDAEIKKEIVLLKRDIDELQEELMSKSKLNARLEVETSDIKFMSKPKLTAVIFSNQSISLKPKPLWMCLIMTFNQGPQQVLGIDTIRIYKKPAGYFMVSRST